jgi:hypothetical protein
MLEANSVGTTEVEGVITELSKSFAKEEGRETAGAFMASRGGPQRS